MGQVDLYSKSYPFFPRGLQEECAFTWATPSSQPRITSCLPILNLKGFPLSREESNLRPSVREPERSRDRFFYLFFFFTHMNHAKKTSVNQQTFNTPNHDSFEMYTSERLLWMQFIHYNNLASSKESNKVVRIEILLIITGAFKSKHSENHMPEDSNYSVFKHHSC